MRTSIGLALAVLVVATGCGDGSGAEASSPSASAERPGAAKPGGTITVGDSTWTIVPSIQCSIYPGNVVSIAGHSAGDESLEIVIDHGGPNQVRIGEGTDALWHSVRDSMKVEIEGRRVRGTATFTQYATATGESAPGSWDVSC